MKDEVSEGDLLLAVGTGLVISLVADKTRLDKTLMANFVRNTDSSTDYLVPYSF